MSKGVKGVLYELYDYYFTYLLHCPKDGRAVVLVEDGLYAMRSKHPRLKIFPNDPFERAILVVLPFWIYPSKQLLERAKKILEIDAETTEKIFRYAEKFPRDKFDRYTILKKRELASVNTEGMLEIIKEVEYIQKNQKEVEL